MSKLFYVPQAVLNVLMNGTGMDVANPYVRSVFLSGYLPHWNTVRQFFLDASNHFFAVFSGCSTLFDRIIFIIGMRSKEQVTGVNA